MCITFRKNRSDHFSKAARLSLAVVSFMVIGTSCLKDMPESLPSNLVWNPELAIPMGTDSFGLNAESGFDTTLLEYDTITRLPKWLLEDTIFLEGTMDFNISSIKENLDQINRILFRVNIYNGFPHEVFTQAYFMDEGMNPVDSMFREGPVAAPPGQVKKDGVSISPAYLRKDAIFEKDRILALENSTSMFFRAGFLVSGVDSTLIPYYRYFQYVVEMGAMLDITLEF